MGLGSGPTQQSDVAVSLITASFFGGTALCVDGLADTFGLAVTAGRTLAAAVADGCAPRVEIT